MFCHYWLHRNVYYLDNIIGLAWLGSMCSYKMSSSIVSVSERWRKNVSVVGHSIGTVYCVTNNPRTRLIESVSSSLKTYHFILLCCSCHCAANNNICGFTLALFGCLCPLGSTTRFKHWSFRSYRLLQASRCYKRVSFIVDNGGTSISAATRHSIKRVTTSAIESDSILSILSTIESSLCL